MKIGSLFDGSGGFPLAGSLCGMEPVWASEIEPYPIAVTRSRFPRMRHLGDVSRISGAVIEPVYVITFGSPCQDLSVAGRRAGLKHTDKGDEETTRSGLFMEAVRIIREMREATNGLYPAFVVWENVPGAFSSNGGEDFRTVLAELIAIVEPNAVMPPVPKAGWAYADSYTGDGWSLAYRVLDAQYCGVPQRRRRIYLVLDLRGERAGKVLFEREGLQGYVETGRTPWQGIAGDAENCLGTDDRQGEAQGHPPTVIVKTYDARGNGDGETVNTLTGDHNNRITDYTTIFCIATQQGGAEIMENKSPTITAADRHAVAYSVGNGQLNQISMSEQCNTLDCMHDKQAVLIAFGVDCRNMNESPELYPTIQAKPNGWQSLNFSHAVRVEYLVRRLTPTECARLQGFPDWWGDIDHKDSFNPEERSFWQEVYLTKALTDETIRRGEDGKLYYTKSGKPYVAKDEQKLLGWYNRLHCDSSEYRMWGNGIALPTALYVMQGIAEVAKE